MLRTWLLGAAARPGQLDLTTFDESNTPTLPAMTEAEQLIADMWATGVTPDRYTGNIYSTTQPFGVYQALSTRAGGEVIDQGAY